MTVYSAANILANNYREGNVWTFTRRNAPRLAPRRSNPIERAATIRVVESLAYRIIMRRVAVSVAEFARALAR